MFGCNLFLAFCFSSYPFKKAPKGKTFLCICAVQYLISCTTSFCGIRVIISPQIARTIALTGKIDPESYKNLLHYNIQGLVLPFHQKDLHSRATCGFFLFIPMSGGVVCPYLHHGISKFCVDLGKCAEANLLLDHTDSCPYWRAQVPQEWCL